MNSIHDMGGMDGFGPVVREDDEPVFHYPWEGRVYALTRLVKPWLRGRKVPGFRFILESIPPRDYLRMSYYERWFRMMVTRLRAGGLVTGAEVENGRVDSRSPGPERLAPADDSLGFGLLDLDVPARFAPGDGVRARNLNPRGHNRLPRYVKGRLGTVVEDYGVYALQDSDERGQLPLDDPQHVYSVRFEGRELWGDRSGPRDSVYVDLWEEYLEPA